MSLTALATATFIGLASIAADAATMADLCAAAKLKTAAKFSQCRLKAQSTYARSGDGAKRDAAFTTCADKFAVDYSRAQAKYDTGCAVSGESIAVETELVECADTVRHLVVDTTSTTS